LCSSRVQQNAKEKGDEADPPTYQWGPSGVAYPEKPWRRIWRKQETLAGRKAEMVEWRRKNGGVVLIECPSGSGCLVH
jgi:hypothetical protein